MGPIVKECTTDYADKSIKFVTFDFTSDEGTATAAATAKELGVESIYSEHEKKTGFLLLYDTESKKVLTKLSAKQDSAAWHAAIDKGLAGS